MYDRRQDTKTVYIDFFKNTALYAMTAELTKKNNFISKAPILAFCFQNAPDSRKLSIKHNNFYL
jgi:hypothetical protein